MTKRRVLNRHKRERKNKMTTKTKNTKTGSAAVQSKAFAVHQSRSAWKTPRPGLSRKVAAKVVRKVAIDTVKK